MTRDDSALALQPGAEAVHAAGVAGALSPRLQDLARQFLDARRRASSAMLDMAEALASVRAAAAHGEWGAFLQATGTSDDQAERLLQVAARAGTDPRFRELVQSNFFQSVSTAALVAKAPEAVREWATVGPIAPTRREVERQIAEHKGGEIRTGADFGSAAAPTWPELSPFVELQRAASAFGLLIDANAAGVVVHWPGEDPAGFQRVTTAEALEWVRTDAAGELAQRKALEPQRDMEAGPPGTAFTRALLMGGDERVVELAALVLARYAVTSVPPNALVTAREHSSFVAAMVAAARTWAHEHTEGT